MRGASPSSYLTLPFTPQSRARSGILLPILYHTRTLLSKPKTARPFPTANRHGNNNRPRRNFGSTTQRQASAEKALRPKSDPISFVDSSHNQSSDGPSHSKPRKKKEIPKRPSSSTIPEEKELSSRPSPRIKLGKKSKESRPSTVTAAEQAAFDRLIKDVSEPTTSKEDGEDILDQDEPINVYDPNVDLDSIFEDAIKYLRRQEEQTAKVVARNLLLGPMWKERAIDTQGFDEEQARSTSFFERPLRLASGATLGDEPQTEDERARLEVACDEHRTLVLGKLDSADSDKQIWQVLEEHVFYLVTHLTNDIELEERKSGVHAEKARGTLLRRALNEGKDKKDVRVKGSEPKLEKNLKGNLVKTEAIPVNKILLILYRNYAEYCLHALRLFRKRHPTSSYAPHIISTIKQRGPISYVLGVSVDIYNEFLFLQWTQYSDLHGIADTIEEMLNQGIEGNDVTLTLIKGIARQRQKAMRAFLGPVMQEWWNMRGTVEAWRRVYNCYNRINDDLARRVAALADEAESEDRDSDDDVE